MNRNCITFCAHLQEVAFQLIRQCLVGRLLEDLCRMEPLDPLSVMLHDVLLFVVSLVLMLLLVQVCVLDHRPGPDCVPFTFTSESGDQDKSGIDNYKTILALRRKLHSVLLSRAPNPCQGCIGRGELPPPPPSSGAPSLCPATVSLTPGASFSGICS